MNQEKLNDIAIRKAARLIECENIIRNGMHMIALVADALIEIRDSKLYPENHDTFKDYCKNIWGFGDNYARKLISASKVISNITVQVVPLKESQARELSKLPAEEQNQTWIEAQKSSGKEQPTAKEIKGIVDSKKTPPKDPVKDDPDNIYELAECHVINTQRALISNLQRHFKIGYNRAARLIDKMEENGVVSSPDMQGKRSVIWSTNLPSITTEAELKKNSTDILRIEHLEEMARQTFRLDPAPAPYMDLDLSADGFWGYVISISDELKKPWDKHLFIKPAYGSTDDESINMAVNEMLSKFEDQELDTVIIVLPATPQRKWFQKLMNRHDSQICFPAKKLNLYLKDETTTIKAKRGQWEQCDIAIICITREFEHAVCFQKIFKQLSPVWYMNGVINESQS